MLLATLKNILTVTLSKLIFNCEAIFKNMKNDKSNNYYLHLFIFCVKRHLLAKVIIIRLIIFRVFKYCFIVGY